ncbi:hypothetical protein PBCV1_a225L [Paramecium bursaria Chlorella virus 1]|uniref:Uncharacterized protein n=1 Tax=Paramecium bursaria Chlorella virus 1 TaxID=10506 RepID=Q84545_PBCV1|nr:hypothetical protein PBCV1_a225L [Paramecium bursaria Chlorella virus 1]AAC96593.2 hypothetical protein [Paramecium bursaria Chlorella virus 1]
MENHTSRYKRTNEQRNEHNMTDWVQPVQRLELLVHEVLEDDVNMQKHSREVHYEKHYRNDIVVENELCSYKSSVIKSYEVEIVQLKHTKR